MSAFWMMDCGMSSIVFMNNPGTHVKEYISRDIFTSLSPFLNLPLNDFEMFENRGTNQRKPH